MEPFKNIFNGALVQTLAVIFTRVHPDFDQAKFVRFATASLKDMELKKRVLHIRDALDRCLPTDFDVATKILLDALHPSEDTDRDAVEFSRGGACGFAVWPLSEYIVLRGIEYPDTALAALKEMTKRFSSEFAVRPFIDRYPEDTLALFAVWAVDSNRHVRRLVSEGSRSRLPWGMRLNRFVVDPAPLLPLLEVLKDDCEEYVRRSVANNLNDIAKDHPDVVAGITEQWLVGASKDRARLVKHACRTLIKAGDPRVLNAFGYKPIALNHVSLNVVTPKVIYGNALSFDLTIGNDGTSVHLMIDYVIHFVKANGTRTKKVFKWKDLKDFKAKTMRARRQHVIKPITTRVYYPGMHKLEIIVNGATVSAAEFELVIPGSPA